MGSSGGSLGGSPPLRSDLASFLRRVWGDEPLRKRQPSPPQRGSLLPLPLLSFSPSPPEERAGVEVARSRLAFLPNGLCPGPTPSSGPLPSPLTPGPAGRRPPRLLFFFFFFFFSRPTLWSADRGFSGLLPRLRSDPDETLQCPSGLSQRRLFFSRAASASATGPPALSRARGSGGRRPFRFSARILKLLGQVVQLCGEGRRLPFGAGGVAPRRSGRVLARRSWWWGLTAQPI